MSLISSRLEIECGTCSTSEPLIYWVIDRVQVWAVEGHTGGLMNFNKNKKHVNGIVRVHNLRHYNVALCFC